MSRARARAGVDPVTLGDSAVAQQHAADQRDNCYSGHWDSNGLKPHMRYSFAGAYQANKENVSGLDVCVRGQYTTIGDNLYEHIEMAMDGLMESPAHRDTVLDPPFSISGYRPCP